jgi:hypothetical protein
MLGMNDDTRMALEHIENAVHILADVLEGSATDAAIERVRQESLQVRSIVSASPSPPDQAGESRGGGEAADQRPDPAVGVLTRSSSG